MEGRDEGDSNVLTSEESGKAHTRLTFTYLALENSYLLRVVLFICTVPVEDTCGIPTRGKQDGDVPENETCVSGISVHAINGYY